VSWTPPADNGAPIIDYEVRYRRLHRRDQWSTEQDITGTGMTIFRLAKQNYEVQVRATSRG
jgi:hypothetical protein